MKNNNGTPERRDPTRPLYKISPARAETILKAVEDITEDRPTTTLIRVTDGIQPGIPDLLWYSAEKLRMCLPGADISVSGLPGGGYPEQSVGRLNLMEIQKKLAQPEKQERRAEIQRLSGIISGISDMDIEAIANGLRENGTIIEPQKIVVGIFTRIKGLFTKKS